jgi:hypothetical protein
MNSNILGLIFLIIIVFFFSFKEKSHLDNLKEKIVQCNKLNFDELNQLENQKLSNLNFQISFKNEKKWKKNFLKDHLESYKNKDLSSQGLRFYKVRKRQSGLLYLKTNKINCYFEVSVRPHGNLLDHRTGNMPSLNIKLKDGNIKGITNFLLLKPETRNGNNEIFNSILFKQSGFLAPLTFKTSLFYNEQKFDVLFQEKIAKEMIERNNLRESVILALDETFYWRDPSEAIDFSKFKVSNTKTILLKSEENRNIAEYAASLLNDLNRLHSIDPDDPFRDYSTISNILEKEYFNKLEVFDALLSATYSDHAMQYDDRRFYFDPFYKIFLPIYYDGMGNILEKKKNKLSNRNIKINQLKFLPSAKKGASQAFSAVTQINLEYLLSELNDAGVLINYEELSLIINQIKSNLLYLSSTRDDQLFEISIKKNKEIINSKINSYNKSIIRNFVYYSEDFQKFISCEFPRKNCKDLNINNDEDKARLLRQELYLNDIHYVYLGLNLFGSSSENFYYHNFDNLIKKNFEIKNINNEINIFYNKKTSIEFSFDKKEIYIKNFGQEKVVFFDSNLKDWSIFFTKHQNKNEINENSNFARSDEFGLTSCLTFLNSKIQNLIVKTENMECEDSVNFINTTGDVDNIYLKNSRYDGIDADFSEIIFKNIIIEDSGNDCLDFSYGVYEIINSNLAQCGDKAVSVGEKSSLKIEKINILNSKIGIASKDNSKVFLENGWITNVNNCLSAYNKKQEFWGGYILSNNIMCSEFLIFTEIDKYSKINIKKSILTNKHKVN